MPGRIALILKSRARWVLDLGLVCALFGGFSPALGQIPAPLPEACPRPPIGEQVPEPIDLRGTGGVLNVDLTIHGYLTLSGEARYCYSTPEGQEAPTLRVHPGDQVILRLSNDLARLDHATADAAIPHSHTGTPPGADPCRSGAMTAISTNLHFHGLTIPPVCHQDEVLKTSIQPGDPPFEYRFVVPENEPPGLYWYHPHIHGFGSKQVTGGASGALIVEGLERAIPEVAGLPERVLVIRDLHLMNPDAPPSSAEPVVPKPILDPDGDIANNNTGYGKPARDLSVNFVPVPYPDYTPARIALKPKQRQLWRVLNAAAITYVHLTLLYDKVPQDLGVVAIDGVPVNVGDSSASRIKTVDHLVIPPGSRAEFIIEGPPAGSHGLLISRMINTGPDGENDPNRALASIEASAGAPEPRSRLPPNGAPLPPAKLPWIGDVSPVRTRKLFFSESRSDPSNPMSPTLFFLTLDGETPAVFDPSSPPNIIVHQGDVEDWIIENRSLELHDFHIHQIHFQLREWYGYQVNEQFLRDTVSVPFFDNLMTAYPSIRVRMDFRDPNTVGTFLYHCHLLEHEDGGMMGTIRVEPAGSPHTGM
ncbi:MAG: multicopper oxidase family protein [Steroidobacteraceae bacterium]